MQSGRTTRLYLLVFVFVLSILATGCQGAKGTVTATEKAIPLPLVDTATPAPTRTREILPPTVTPTSTVKVVVSTRTSSPTPTITPNSPQTMSAKATADKSTKCNKLEDAWQIKVTPSWKAGWCQVESLGGYYYEYQLQYPGQWIITTFGDVYPSMAFNTAHKGVELRLYQLYNYSIRKYEGTLEDAPLKAGFCDEKDQCTLVIGALEKITNRAIRTVGGKEVLVVDSQDSKHNIRRYFFLVPFKNATPASNRLFFVKLYTPEPISATNYTDLEKQIFDMIVSIKHDF